MIAPVKILRENFKDLDPPKIVQPEQADLRVVIQTNKNLPRQYWKWRTPKKFVPKPLDKR